MDTQKVRSPIKQNVLAGAVPALHCARTNNYLGTHTTKAYSTTRARESGVLPVIILWLHSRSQEPMNQRTVSEYTDGQNCQILLEIKFLQCFLTWLINKRSWKNIAMFTDYLCKCSKIAMVAHYIHRSQLWFSHEKHWWTCTVSWAKELWNHNHARTVKILLTSAIVL